MSGRMRRVDEAVKQVLSEAIPTLKDPRIGFVTVTAVETTSDLDHAKVWVSVFGTERRREKTLTALEGGTEGGRFCHPTWVEHDDDLASLREHPRFQALLDARR